MNGSRSSHAGRDRREGEAPGSACLAFASDPLPSSDALLFLLVDTLHETQRLPWCRASSHRPLRRTSLQTRPRPPSCRGASSCSPSSAQELSRPDAVEPLLPGSRPSRSSCNTRSSSSRSTRPPPTLPSRPDTPSCTATRSCPRPGMPWSNPSSTATSPSPTPSAPSSSSPRSRPAGRTTRAPPASAPSASGTSTGSGRRSPRWRQTSCAQQRRTGPRSSGCLRPTLASTSSCAAATSCRTCGSLASNESSCRRCVTRRVRLPRTRTRIYNGWTLTCLSFAHTRAARLAHPSLRHHQ